MSAFTVSDYLLQRLNEIGINHLFGVPGDFNLTFLDRVIAHPRLAWVGCANELNAAYAADGYARSRGAAALLTTFGVGELSAINGTAGSYAEYLPVIHIVGAPSLAAQRRGDLIHHSLGDGDFSHFLRMQREVTVAQAVLNAENACAEIDRVIGEALKQRRPGYLLLPVDVVGAAVDAPAQPLLPRNVADTQVLNAFRAAADKLLAQAGSVSLLADFLADRFDVTQQLAHWLEAVPLPHATLLMGKGILNEQQPGFVGTYAGEGCAEEARRAIEQAEAIITVGVRFTDTITVGFTQRIAPARNIDVQPFSATVAGEHFSPLPMDAAVTALRQLCERYAARWPQPVCSPAPLAQDDRPVMTQNAFWQAMQDFLRPGDLILAEQGTAAFGAAALRLPAGAQLVTQPLWGSIGYTLPAAFGAQTAQPERRVILLIGDGSAQLTVQELSSMMRDNLKPLIFLLNNEGYTVERAINGADQRYNDIAAWNWTQIPQALSESCPAQSWRVVEPVQLTEVMKLIADAPRLSLVEVVLPRLDLPPLLQQVSASLNQRNSA
ncbi:alpha-keto acid decarboxylase family protein [Mixta intestinalis]|uniref:Indole-3-pyruvate decarboxylase n=1 Tax=Mixta intestinalis TaxID=1615494 RepID=A0A6P1Q111_9GAMM|nr:thiamine pyrophosphate-binding protein [Mixta intestinalis]QHM71944.1 Indole-3-pyruvate decarboxylase [Mixta intestinalis]